MAQIKPNWGAITVILIVVVSVITATRTIDNQIAKQSQELTDKIAVATKEARDSNEKTNTRVTKLEGAVKTLADQQSDPLKTVIHDLLAAATNAIPGRPDVAARAVGVVDSLLATLKKEKRPADPQYFQSAIATIDELSRRIPLAKSRGETHRPELKEAVFSTKISIAEYRSALEPTPPIAGLTWLIALPNSENGVGYINVPIHSNQVNFDFSFLGQREAIKVVPPLKGLLSENVVIENAYIKGGYNVLDGIHWRNVVFIGAHVIYRGGELELQNVRFVNCNFEVPFDDRGSQITEYAALAKDHLVIPG